MTAYTTIDWLHAPASLLAGRRFIARFEGGTVVDGFLSLLRCGPEPYVDVLTPDCPSLPLGNLRILTIDENPPRSTDLNRFIEHLTVTMQTKEDKQ